MPLDSPRPSGVPPWRLLAEAEEASLADTRLTLHHAVQLLASFGQALVEPRTDDSHRSMTWDAGLEAFRGEATADGLYASLGVPDFTLALWRDGRRLALLDLTGRSSTEAKAWLEYQVTDAGATPAALAWPEYDLPKRPGDRNSALAPDAGVLAALAAWYGNAATVLEAVTRAVPEASDVRCWPHHFDLATLLTFPNAGPGGEARYVGLGLSPGDASLDIPYYYVNGWPAPAPADLRPLAGPGSWHTQGWVGAVLTAREVTAIGDPAAQRAMVEGFLADATSAMRSAVVGEP